MRKLIVLLALAGTFWHPVPGDTQMRVHTINVGQADAILLEMKTAAVLIDAGGEDRDSPSDSIHLSSYLDRFFQRRTDLRRTLHSVIVSHPHTDHTEHLPMVLRRYRVRNLVDGGDTHGSGIASVRAARRLAAEKEIVYNRVRDSRVRQSKSGYTPAWLGDLRKNGSDVDIRFLSGSRNCQNGNNSTLVTRVAYRGTVFLFAGDAESEPPKGTDCEPLVPTLLKRYSGTPWLDVDVYKVSHHGSEDTSYSDFLQAMSPRMSVISAGRPDRPATHEFTGFMHGHPRESAVARIEQATTGMRSPLNAYTMNGPEQIRSDRRIEKAIYCTCWDGDVVLAVDTEGKVSVQTSTP